MGFTSHLFVIFLSDICTENLFLSHIGRLNVFYTPPGKVTRSIFDARNSCFSVSITWHVNESLANI